MERLGFVSQRAEEASQRLKFDNIKFNNSKAIMTTLSMIKRSTCKEDKLLLGNISQILKEKIMLKTVNDTEKV